MTRRGFGGAVALALALLFGLPGARAETLHVVKSNPAAGAVIDSNSNQFEILFDGMIDPRQSSLSVSRNGEVVETLHPSFDAAPGVLFARGPRLQPGEYKLHWSVKSVNGAEVTQGDIQFTVKS
jgi:methionine-rich copper-binding protein CopC